MTKSLFITIPSTPEGLKQAAEEIMPDDEPVHNKLADRVKWDRIRREYYHMRSEGIKSKPAREQLSEDYHLSLSTIDRILWR